MTNSIRLLLLLSICALWRTASAQTCSVSITQKKCTGDTLQAITDGNKRVDTLTWYKNAIPVQISTLQSFHSNPDTLTAYDPNNSYFVNDFIVDDSGNIYTTGGCRISKWTKRTNTWAYVAGKDGDCGSTTAIQTATSFAVDPQGYIYIGEAGGHRLTKWYNGSRISVMNTNVGYPVKVCLDKANNVYVLDQTANAVYKFPSGKNKYTVVAGGNGAGAALNQFNIPSSMTIDDAGNLYIGDPFNNRVTKWAPGTTQGIVVAGGGSNNGSVYDIHPDDVEVDSVRNLYILDDRRVTFWPVGTSAGIYVGNVLSNVTNPSNAYRIALDKNRNLYEMFLGYGYLFPPTKILDKTCTRTVSSYLYLDTGGDFTVRSAYSNGCSATSAAVHLVNEPNYPYIEGQQTGVCRRTLPYDNYYVNDPTHPSLAWTMPQGATIVSGQGTDSIRVRFDSTFIRGNIKLTSANTCRSYTTRYFVWAAPANSSIEGIKKVNANQRRVRYSLYFPNQGTTTWTVPAGATIAKGQGTDTIYVNFGTSSGTISSVTTNECGSASNDSLLVTIKSAFVPDAKETAPVAVIKSVAGDATLYPQPASNATTLRFSSEVVETVSVAVTDLYGKTVYTAMLKAVPGINTHTIPLAALRSGTYLVSIYSHTVERKTIKLVVMR